MVPPDERPKPRFSNSKIVRKANCCSSTNDGSAPLLLIGLSFVSCCDARASVAMIASVSKTQPPQVPPPTACKAAQSRVSSGRSGSAESWGCGDRSASTRVPSFGAELDSVGTDQVERPFELDAVDDDPDQVAVAELADRPAGQRLGTDMSDARAGGNAREPGVGQDRHVLAERQDIAAPP